MPVDPKKQAELDQSAAMLGDHWPALWRRMYEGCLRLGFSEDDSLKLVQTYIIAYGSGDKRAP